MAERCFKEKDSNPLICGVHKVPLVRKQLPFELTAAGFKAFTFLVCPVSGEVLTDETAHSQDNIRVEHNCRSAAGPR